jgi:ABC-type branched-subunit amino acid transport system permease subunit
MDDNPVFTPVATGYAPEANRLSSYSDRVTRFLYDHWVIGGIVTSLLWFLVGWQSFRARKLMSALLWQSIGGFIAAALCVWAVKEREWVGFFFGLTLLCFEGRSIRRLLALIENAPRSED